ncbi:hypothetical protein KC324_g62 [Hortaea werneckii]|nr:hypothetical protein KC324_g62 [Hortaea werneckii]
MELCSILSSRAKDLAASAGVKSSDVRQRQHCQALRSLVEQESLQAQCVTLLRLEGHRPVGVSCDPLDTALISSPTSPTKDEILSVAADGEILKTIRPQTPEFQIAQEALNERYSVVLCWIPELAHDSQELLV